MLTNKQKKYIKKNIKKRSIEQIALYLDIPEKTVNDFVYEYLGKNKYQKYFKTKENLNEPKIANIKDFITFLKLNRQYFILLFIFALVPYFFAFNNGFVSDDRGIILNLPSYKLSISVFFPFFDVGGFTQWLIYKFFGFNQILLHSINIFFHLGSVLLLFTLLSFISKKSISFFAASLFAVHPIFIESVTWVSGRTYAQYSFFFLLALIFYIFSFKNRKYFYFSLFAFWLCLGSSEKSIVLFLVFVLYEYCFGSIRKNWKKLSAYFFLAILYTGYFFLILGKLGTRVSSLQADTGASLGMDNPFLQIPVAITSYLWLIFWPADLTLYHSELSLSSLNFIIRLIIFLGFLVLLFILNKKNRFVFFWLMLFIIALLPTLTPFRISWIVAERYVYLGAIGILVSIAVLLEKVSEIKKYKMQFYTAFFILLILLSVRTILRNSDWHNEDTLWVATAKTSPSSPNTHNNMGDVYSRHGDFKNAQEEFKRAIKIKPNYAEAYHNLANVYIKMGKKEDAIKNYQKAIFYNPSLWQSHLQLADIYLTGKKYKNAEEEIRKAIKINPGEIDLTNNLGTVYLKEGDKKKAKEIFTNVLLSDPLNTKAKAGLEEASK